MASQWFYAREGQRYGPFSSKQLRQLAREGTLQRNDLLWKRGMTDWRSAEDSQNLFPLDEQDTFDSRLLFDSSPPIPSRSASPPRQDAPPDVRERHASGEGSDSARFVALRKEGKVAWEPATLAPATAPLNPAHGSPSTRATWRRRFLAVVISLSVLAGVAPSVREWWSRDSSDPFRYDPVTGRIAYEDGSPIPAETLTATFVPQAPAKDPKTRPRAGVATVDVTSGSFKSVSSHRTGDGIVRGEHVVVISDQYRRPLPSSVIPDEYASTKTSPLRVHSKDAPFDLKVRRPTDPKPH